ncbi:hypothetical protein PR048_022008 [Dryococelus australis]|uniref:Uncharacterized protein n=1 Tax=Dryococelus australis TaxID=614101 RepID=A0ABQ9H005_9NEOP|nr:hypothetical protein PR048_022008 [Dryococelus australis]
MQGRGKTGDPEKTQLLILLFFLPHPVAEANRRSETILVKLVGVTAPPPPLLKHTCRRCMNTLGIKTLDVPHELEKILGDNLRHYKLPRSSVGAAMLKSDCSPPMANRVLFPAEVSEILHAEIHGERFRWPAGFLGVLPEPPGHEVSQSRPFSTPRGSDAPIRSATACGVASGWRILIGSDLASDKVHVGVPKHWSSIFEVSIVVLNRIRLKLFAKLSYCFANYHDYQQAVKSQINTQSELTSQLHYNQHFQFCQNTCSVPVKCRTSGGSCCVALFWRRWDVARVAQGEVGEQGMGEPNDGTTSRDKTSVIPRYDANHSTGTMGPRWVSGQTPRLKPMRTGLDSLRGRSRIFSRGNHARRCRWSAIFLDLSFPPLLHSGTAPYVTLIGSQDLDQLACSPSTKANRVQPPAGSLQDLRKWKSCRTMPLVGEFSREQRASLPVRSSAEVAERMARYKEERRRQLAEQFGVRAEEAATSASTPSRRYITRGGEPDVRTTKTSRLRAAGASANTVATTTTTSGKQRTSKAALARDKCPIVATHEALKWHAVFSLCCLYLPVGFPAVTL